LLLTPDAPEFAAFKRRDFDSDSLARLYALGLDAYRIAASFGNGPPNRFELEGAARLRERVKRRAQFTFCVGCYETVVLRALSV